MAEGVSFREFARLEGCNEKLVRRKVQSGHLVLLSNGKLDPALIGTAWRERNKPGESAGADTPADRGADTPPESADTSQKTADTADTPRQPGDASYPETDPQSVALASESIEEEASRLVFEEGRVFGSEAEAKRHKESFLAHLRELEYHREIGLVVLIADVVQAVSAEYALVRSRLTNISARVAPRVAILKSPAEVKALLDEEVELVLQELTVDQNGDRERAGRNISDRFAKHR